MQRNNTLPHGSHPETELMPIEGCGECADDLLEKVTGCRFGEPENCKPNEQVTEFAESLPITHEDCWW